MRIFNQEKTQELQNVDLEKGYLQNSTLITHIPEQTAVEEKFHYETVREYPNGGKDVEKVIDVEGRPHIPAHDDIENIQIYIPYTAEEIAQMDRDNKIENFKKQLCETDFIACKLSEAVAKALVNNDTLELTQLYQHYAVQLNERENLREEIRKLGG